MGRDKQFPLDDTQKRNAAELLARVNFFLGLLRIKDAKVSSGYRPSAINKAAGGAARSGHITCEAVDIHDPDGSIGLLIMNNLDIMEECGLYLEHLDYTKGWIHLSTRKPASGNRIFRPY
jgi:hypothetical protein